MSSKRPQVTPEQAKAALDRIAARQSNMKTESAALGYRYNLPLRRALIALIGREKFFELIAPEKCVKKPRQKRGDSFTSTPDNSLSS